MMRIILFSIMVFICCTTQSSAVIVGQSMAVSSGATNSVTFYHDCDDTGDANKSIGSATMTDNHTTIDSVTPIQGAGSWDFNASTAYSRMRAVYADNFNTDTGRIGFKVTLAALTIGNIVTWETESLGYIRIYTDTIRVSSRGTSTYGTFSFSIGTEYFVEVSYSCSSVEVFVDGTSLGTGSIGSNIGTPAYVNFGAFSSAVPTVKMDQVLFSSDPNENLYLIRSNSSF